ncbi:MAG TPA: TRAP transporter TatT component family protein [Candidatus Saccharimonadia bacterium]|nr:TRAP transporter TatT component family protein [Candidatus Saccharimonadia bacterium]
MKHLLSGLGGDFSRKLLWVFAAVLLTLSCGACSSVRKMAVNQLGNALSSSGTTFSSDDDPEFVAAAVPFSLKMMESLLAETPKHKGLLLSTTSYFTQYGFAFIQQEADELEEKDLAAANEKRDRASRMFKRAWAYGMRGLEVDHPGFEKAFNANPREAVKQLTKADVPQLFWTAAAGGLRIRADRPETVAEQPKVEALIDRALELDESYDKGVIHSFLIKYEMNRQGVKGEASKRARKHFARAVALSGGKDPSPYVSLAEAVSVPKQDAKEFEMLLNKALAIDVDAQPETRLSSTVMQRRARWLLARKDELILPELEPLPPVPDEAPATTTITPPTTPLLPKP